MKIELIDIDKIIPYNKNPRYNEDAIDYVRQSIEDYGYLNPILINKDNIIISGHTRYEALKDLNKKQIEVIRIVDLTPELEKAFRIADNKVAEFSYWDNAKLQKELSQVIDNTLKYYDFEYNNLDEVEINEDDYISDIDQHKKELICPYCGEKIE